MIDYDSFSRCHLTDIFFHLTDIFFRFSRGSKRVNKSTLYKKYLFFKPASGSGNYHEFIACIGIGTDIGIEILMRYQDSYRNRY